MIVTTADRLTEYKEIPYAEDIAEFLNDFIKGDMKTGRYEIHGEELFASAAEYETEPFENKKFESHKKYIDLQIVLRGKEEIHWADVKTLTMTEEEFSKGGDIAFYKGDSQGNVVLGGMQCAVLFPEDAHMPGVMHKTSQKVLKIVIKIKK